jgi:16S rRNA (adenine1518-N6/adenine1519-N6)-dimethyltransferase
MKKKQKERPFAKKSLGQNFLADQNYIRRILEAVNPQGDDTIVEIGAGRGVLTEKLIEKAGKVIAIELDSDLIPILNETFVRNKNYLLIHQDALKINFTELIENTRLNSKKAKLAANLPYYISTAILQHLIEFRESFSEMVLMLQKEVVQRITAQAGNSERGYLTVLIEAYFNSEKLFDVPPNAFRPAPKVQSSVLRLTPKLPGQNKIKEEFFKKLVSIGFRQKRKTLLNNLKNEAEFFANKNIGEILEEANISPNLRAEDLSLEHWFNLLNFLENSMKKHPQRSAK